MGDGAHVLAAVGICGSGCSRHEAPAAWRASWTSPLPVLATGFALVVPARAPAKAVAGPVAGAACRVTALLWIGVAPVRVDGTGGAGAVPAGFLAAAVPCLGDAVRTLRSRTQPSAP